MSQGLEASSTKASVPEAIHSDNGDRAGGEKQHKQNKIARVSISYKEKTNISYVPFILETASHKFNHHRQSMR